MWFTQLILILMSLTLMTYIAGRPLTIALFKDKLLSVENFCVSILFGTFAISYLFAIGSYCNLPGSVIGPIILALLLITGFILLWKKTLWFEVTNKKLLQFFLLYFLVIIVSLITILIHHSFTPYNDAIVYIGISDYLQDHGFLKRYVDPDSLHPINALILVFQGARTRMGANFFLAAIQSIFHVNKAITIFPLSQSWGVLLNIASITVACRWIFHLRWKSTLIILFLIAVTFNPLYYSVHYGFNNQLYGMAYYTIVLATFNRLIKNSYNQNALRFTIVTAVFLASVVLFYPELFPFTSLALALCAFIPLIRNKPYKKYWLLLLSLLAVFTIIISNVSFLGMIRFQIIQLRAIVGWNVGYSYFGFITTALGIMPAEKFGYMINFVGLVFLVLFIVGTYAAFRRKIVRYAPWISAIFVFSASFLIFYFFVSNPWIPNTKGQTWSMFKIMSWAYPCFILGVAYGISQIRWNKSIVTVLSVLAIISGVISHPLYYKHSLIAQRFTGSNYPFSAYQKFADVVNKIKTDQPIELIINNSRHQEILAYYLSPTPVMADWRMNCYLSYTKNRNMQLNDKHYIITDAQNVITNKGVPLVANTVLIDSSMPYIKSFEDFHDGELSSTMIWHRWSSGKSSIIINNDREQNVKVSFDVGSAVVPAKLMVHTNTKLLEVPMNDKNPHHVEFITDFKKGSNKITLTTDIQPTKVKKDPRLLAFSVSNFKVMSTTIPSIKSFNGFSSQEFSGTSSWRWSDGKNASLLITNEVNLRAKITFMIATVSVPEIVNIQVADNAPTKIRITKGKWQPVELFVNLKAGENLLSFKTDGKAKKVGNDPRLLDFVISDVRISTMR